MKRRQKIGLGAAFCAGMLALSSCSTPQPLYGAPDMIAADHQPQSEISDEQTGADSHAPERTTR